jgi:exopolysaccharide biosynthesis polyprenyl glycosylphosphotransferase
MAARLALLEGSSLFMAMSGAMLLWGRVPFGTWIDVVGVLGQALGLSLCYVTTFYFTDLYDLRIVRTFRDFVPRLVQAVGLALLVATLLYLSFPHFWLTEGVVTSSLVVMVAIVVALRAASYGVLGSRSFGERVLILGRSALTTNLIREIEERPHCGFSVAGIVDDANGGHEGPTGYPLLGPLPHLHKIVEEVAPDRIVVGLGERRGRLPVQQLLESRVRGIPVEDGVRFHERLTGKLAIETLTPSSLIFAEDFRKSRLEMAFGRVVSLVVALIGVAVCAPLFLLIALLVKVDSRGPIFFLHERVGLRGTRFQLIKFRTMRPAVGKTSEWECDNAARITRVGWWLRRFRLDELPQFINIIRGEMNVVGPRPHPVSNFELFTERIPYYGLRGLVRPGVTGWAQIRYTYANNLEEETEKMRFDLFYIKHMSPGLDVRILAETVKIVLFGRESH